MCGCVPGEVLRQYSAAKYGGPEVHKRVFRNPVLSF